MSSSPMIIFELLVFCSIMVLAVFMALFRSTVLHFTQLTRNILIGAIIISVIFAVTLWHVQLQGSLPPWQQYQTDVMTSPQSFQSSDSGSNYFYGIMFDAGSTGSRLHVFKFNKDVKGNVYHLVEQLYHWIIPGLSAYADQPSNASESLRPLLNKALEYIPRSCWNSTLIALKATAGLRLLSNNTALRILTEVQNLFRAYPFRLVEDSITMLEGMDEGLFSWFGVNFLNGLTCNSTSTAGVLDLGGGSTQIAFASSSKSSSKHMNQMVSVTFDSCSYNVYSHSYLGFGMNSVRFRILGGKESPDGVTQSTFHSVCLPDNYTGTWKYGGHSHTIKNVRYSTRLRYHNCKSTVLSVIKLARIERISNISETSSFYALSYFVDRALSIKLIDSQKNGGTATVEDFVNAARRECNYVSSNDPFLCLDLCYISSLLRDGYGIKSSTVLQLRRRLNHIELGWPLGAMLHVFGKFSKQTLPVVQ